MKKIQSANDAYKFAKQFALEEDKRHRLILIYTKDDGTVVGWTEREEGAAMPKIPQFQKCVEISRAIIVTNHPSGSSLPDKYDIAETKRMRGLLELNDIGLTDQIIVGYKEFFSYATESVTFVNK